jgi:threonine/homoserine efflux transporter RhtA
VPLLPWYVELVALRGTTAAIFSTLMSQEPAVATVVGAIVLSQLPSVGQVARITAVVLAATGAARAQRRRFAGTAPRRVRFSGGGIGPAYYPVTYHPAPP